MSNEAHRYARVVVDLPGVGREFDYIIPSAFQGRVQKGTLVIVPFGDRRAYGIVIDTCTQSEHAQRAIEA
ncbi:MAG: hypothetical protein N3A60_10510, partial [Thermanaerothrix sp.]|nr:hypothetical protein [Thermanaerothrix sp.]